MIVATLDDETLTDARAELDRLKTRRRELDQQIAQAESATTMDRVDPEVIADDVLDRARTMAGSTNLPIPALRAWLASVVEKVVVDLETKDIEISLMLPAETFGESAFSGEKAMRLVGTSPSPSSDETHHSRGLLALSDCQHQEASKHICD